MDCRGSCLKVSQASNLTVVNNVFFVGRRYVVRVDSPTNFNFSNNLMIGVLPISTLLVQQRQSETTACFLYSAIPNFNSELIAITDNVCHGSSGNGFILPYTPCSYSRTDISFANNEAGSCITGFLFNWANSRISCVSASNITAYNCETGFMGNPPSTNLLQYKFFTLADNQRSLVLKHGFGSLNHDNNSVVLASSWISALARPSCSYCYGNLATDCISNQGIQMMASTINGSSISSTLADYDTNFDRIDKPAGLDSKAFINSVTFDNFKQSYVGFNECGNNVIFKPHPDAYELIGSHYLTNSASIGCDLSANAFFTPPTNKSLGCGDIDCTGRNNYIVQDRSGHLFG